MKIFSSTGRVNLIGEHIDYNGGLVLPVCIDIGTYAKVTKRNDSLMVVKSLNFEGLGYISFDLKSELKAENNWVDYVKGVSSSYYFNNYPITLEPPGAKRHAGNVKLQSYIKI